MRRIFNRLTNSWPALLVVLILPACSTKRLLISDSESILTWMKEENVPTVGVCMIENAKIQQVKMFGNLEHRSPAPLNTLFNIASLTKPLVSTATLKLVSMGQWQLDEPLCHYWTDPDVANDPFNKKLTTRHVLSHQSGLPNWRGHEPNGKLAFAFEPGTQWKYSGEGFEYLRKALENKFNMPIERLVDSLLFEPLDMNDTRFYWDSTMDTTLYADRHRADGSLYEAEKWYSANASNLVLTTVEDYGKFGVALLKGKYLSDEVQNEMIQTQAVPKTDKVFGLGWPIINDLSKGGYALVHTGSNRGQNTIIILLPKTKKGIVIFTNGDHGRKVFENIISKYFDSGDEILARMK